MVDEEKAIAKATRGLNPKAKQEFMEFYSNTEDERTKAIVLALLRRRTLKGRLESLWVYLIYGPIAALLSLGSAAVIIFLIAFLSAFICGKL